MRALLIATVALLALAGSASAHATYFSTDGKVKIIVGQLGEPVYTYQRSGLDLHLRDNATNMEFARANATLTAVWLAPGGQELACPLKVQHAQVGKYTCTEAWTLTQPGLYKLRLTGTVNGTNVTGTYANKHEISEQKDIMFPDKGLPTTKELDAKNKALEAELVALKGRVDKLGNPTTAATSIPGFEVLMGLGALGTVALGLRLRRS